MFSIFIANDPLTGDWREDAGDGDKLRQIYLLGERNYTRMSPSLQALSRYILNTDWGLGIFYIAILKNNNFTVGKTLIYNNTQNGIRMK